jgi:DNA polymerase-1
VNFQNIPRDDKTVKRAVLPKRGAFSWFDYSQIEPRIFGYYCQKGLGDDLIVKMYVEGRDVYKEIASLAYGISPENVSPQQRQYGKIGFLAILYGAGPKAIAEQLKITKKEAKDLYDGFHEGLPQIRLLSNPPPRTGSYPDYSPGMIERIIRQRGYIKTPYGRHLHPEKYGAHKLLNKLIQGTAADLMKAALRRIDAYLDNTDDALPLASRMVTSIHDEVGFDGPIEEIHTLHGVVPDLMREAWLTDVIPVEVDHEISFESWADKIDYDEWCLP